MVPLNNSVEKQDILLSLGWFRSGTTYLFNCLKNSLPDWEHFYEPFNPGIGRFVEQYQQLQQNHPGKTVRLKIKPGQEDFLFHPYFIRQRFVNRRFSEKFGLKNFLLSSQSRQPDMERYLRGLTRSPHPIHLQLNRGLGRLPWLSRIFPRARLIVILRNPCAVWASMQGYPEDLLDPRLDPGKFQLNRLLSELVEYQHGQGETELNLKKISFLSPFQRFLLAWGHLHKIADQCRPKFKKICWIKYEELVTDQAETVRRLGKKLALKLHYDQAITAQQKPLERWKGLTNSELLQTLLNSLPDDHVSLPYLQKFNYLTD